MTTSREEQDVVEIVDEPDNGVSLWFEKNLPLNELLREVKAAALRAAGGRTGTAAALLGRNPKYFSKVVKKDIDLQVVRSEALSKPTLGEPDSRPFNLDLIQAEAKRRSIGNNTKSALIGTILKDDQKSPKDLEKWMELSDAMTMEQLFDLVKIQAFKHTGGNLTKASALLGVVNRTNFYLQMPAKPQLKQALAEARSKSPESSDGRSFNLKRIERARIERSIRMHHSIAEAAKSVGLNSAIIYSKLAKYREEDRRKAEEEAMAVEAKSE